MTTASSRGRALAGLGVGAAICSGTAALLVRTATSAWLDLQQPAPDPDNAIAVVAALAGLGVCLWLGLAAVLTAAGAVLTAATAGARRAGPVARRLQAAAEAITPATVRRLVVVAVGVSLAATAAPAQAAAGHVGVPAAAGAAAAVEVGVGWGSAADPGHPRGTTRATGTGPATTSATASTTASATGAVVVRPGDTLWSLAAAHLPRGAGAAEVSQAWPHWFAANRQVIGRDPDHLVPGQRLVPPAATGTARHRAPDSASHSAPNAASGSTSGSTSTTAASAVPHGAQAPGARS